MNGPLNDRLNLRKLYVSIEIAQTKRFSIILTTLFRYSLSSVLFFFHDWIRTKVIEHLFHLHWIPYFSVFWVEKVVICCMWTLHNSQWKSGLYFLHTDQLRFITKGQQYANENYTHIQFASWVQFSRFILHFHHHLFDSVNSFFFGKKLWCELSHLERYTS